MTKDELHARRAAAQARLAGATLTDGEREEAALLQEEAEALTAARLGEAARRTIIGKRLEMEARSEAAGAYHVEWFDLGKLLPDADPEKLPGRGVLVIRSHTTASKRAFDRDVEHKNGEGAKSLGEIFTDLVVANVVRPAFFDPAGKPINTVEALAFRRFFESDIGNGCPSQVGAAILRLGGAVATETKRAT